MKNFISKSVYLVCAASGTTLLFAGVLCWIVADTAETFYNERG